MFGFSKFGRDNDEPGGGGITQSKRIAALDNIQQEKKKKKDDDIQPRKIGHKMDGTKKKLVPRAFEKIKHHANNKTLTQKARNLVGLKPITPEVSSGHATFLDRFAPKVAENLGDMPSEDQANAARKSLMEVIESDPDSVFHFFGEAEREKQINSMFEGLR